MRTYALLSRYPIPIYNTLMWIPAILTFNYLIVTIQSVMKILSTKINMLFAIIGATRKQAFFANVEYF